MATSRPFLIAPRRGPSPRGGQRPRTGRRIQSVDRAVDILAVVAASTQPLSPSEVAARLRLERTTVHRLMATLAARRLLRFDPERRKYHLGVGAFELGSAYLHAQMEDRVVERIMDALVREVNHTVSLGALVDDEVVILLARQSDHIVTINSRPGDRLAPHASAIGKLFLAERSDAEVRSFLSRVGMPRLTPRTITSIRAFLADLREVRARGVAYAHEEAQLGVSSMGVAVRTAGGALAAGLVVAPPAQFATSEALARMLPPLRRAAAAIEAAGVIRA
ncbi:MAG TPA: IclR family transcriptional regulator [bacterium]|nr:IclR family transcriptional regulator [bacterium]